MTSHNQVKPYVSSFNTVDYGANSGVYAHQGRRPSQNLIKPNKATDKNAVHDQDYMKQVSRHSYTPVKTNIASFTAPEKPMPRRKMNQVRPNHASGNYNEKPVYDSQEETSEEEGVSGSEEDEDDSKWWRRPPISGKVNTNETSFAVSSP